ncbi:DUF2235 domain-containing protein [uncultured Cocleimonas sp.]|uniref:DUF2235 domain-containing protein n=1 Tax=uncultured Cocleimonas sp. TaxID=1051587 RepID=UPI002621B859|nr:DUF2235 domain-containing protein [uncultured Cocleimonas sp.]
MKNIILSTDGTGSAGGVGHGTNVWRLHTAIDRQSHLTVENNKRQVAFYHDGVGTQDKKILKIIGGAFGYGLKRTIKELYTFLINNYEPGDQIYLFGFSRGAYTVRLLAGMILACGILDRKRYDNKSDTDLANDVENVYRLFQELLKQTKDDQIEEAESKPNLANKTRKSFRTISTKINPVEDLPKDIHLDIKIRFMGVWDTVDAYAIPSDTLAKVLDKFFYISFREHDNALNEKVEKACHVLSIDDKRRTFEPVLWREVPENNDHERIKQVWFSGVHANIGGGYPRQGIAWNTLEWMMLHAKQAGLRFVAEDIDQFTENKDVNDKMYDSRSGLAAYYAYKLRKIDKLWDEYSSTSSKPRLHISVFERIATRAEGYAPSNIPIDFEIITTKPICADKETISDSSKKYCVQFLQTDIEALEAQVSKALKEFQAKKQTPSFFEKMKAYIHQRSSYIFFIGMALYWATGFATFEKSWETFSISIIISVIYWLIIWKISALYTSEQHKKYSAFWRKVSSDKAWDFLRQ